MSLLDTQDRHWVIKLEHVPDEMQNANVDQARDAVRTGDQDAIMKRLLAGSGVTVEDVHEAMHRAAEVALRDLIAAGHVTDQRSLDLANMIACTMWMDGLLLGLRHGRGG